MALQVQSRTGHRTPIMSTDQATIDRLRAELAEARAIATEIQAENRAMQSRLNVIKVCAEGLQKLCNRVTDLSQ